MDGIQLMYLVLSLYSMYPILNLQLWMEYKLKFLFYFIKNTMRFLFIVSHPQSTALDGIQAENLYSSLAKIQHTSYL